VTTEIVTAVLVGWALVYARSRVWRSGIRDPVPDDCECRPEDEYTDARGTWCARCGARK